MRGLGLWIQRFLRKTIRRIYMDTILSHYCLDGKPVKCERYGCGHINETYLVVTDKGHRYILQKINNRIFKNVPQLMANIAAVTAYLGI